MSGAWHGNGMSLELSICWKSVSGLTLHWVQHPFLPMTWCVISLMGRHFGGHAHPRQLPTVKKPGAKRGCQPGKRTLLLLLPPLCLPVFVKYIFWIFAIQSQNIILFSTYIHCSLYLWGGGFSAPHLAPTCAPLLAPGVGGCPKPCRGSAS